MKPAPARPHSLTRRQWLSLAAAAPLLAQSNRSLQGRSVFIIPNFHPASCGWLTNFSKERVYCANTYFDHLDRVRDDPEYAFVLSECNNMIAMMNFQPGRIDELKRGIKSGRVELVNGFFLESTINLSGGEALVRLGVEGLRWQKAMFGVRPRFAWTIDVCGTHDQMAQITSGLGLEAMVYTRKNPTGSAMHWAVSPDGSRTLAISPGHYSELGGFMAVKDPMTPQQFEDVEKAFEQKLKITPEGAPILILAGSGDYALAPLRKEYPSEFLAEWKKKPERPQVRFATLSQFVDAVVPCLKDGRVKIPSLPGGTAYDFDSFWIQCPKVKTWYRSDEHKLQAAEMLSTAASLQSNYAYPAETLYHAWLQMFLNMDRNTLWGAAGGMVFEHPTSWDAQDRFQWVERQADATLQAAGSALVAKGDGVAFFNPLNWTRHDPLVVASSLGLEGQSFQPGLTLAHPEFAATCLTGIAAGKEAAPPRSIPLPEFIDTKYYRAKIDPKTGTLISLRTKPGNKEMLGGPANVLVAEKSEQKRGDPGDFTLPREARTRVESSSDSPATVSVIDGPLVMVVEVDGSLFGNPSKRRMIFHRNYPRIDFQTEIKDIPDKTVVVAEFPLATPIAEMRRGVPYGFSHGAWSKPNPDLHGWTKGIVPAVRWSHYTQEGGGVALLDRGLSGRELTAQTPLIFLYNATAKYYGYPNSWLSGDGEHQFEYALVAHEGEWQQARVPHMAWEYSCPPMVVSEHAAALASKPLLTTSNNVIVEAMRRTGSDIEVRLAECLGHAGTAEVTLTLPHKGAALTDLTGANPKPVKGGPHYKFPVRPQQIVTLRFKAASSVADPKPLTEWDPLVPEHKRAALREYSNEKGHPPRGN